MAAFTQIILLPTSVETMEVLVARSAIGFAQELSLDQIILEGDSKLPSMCYPKEDGSLLASGTSLRISNPSLQPLIVYPLVILVG